MDMPGLFPPTRFSALRRALRADADLYLREANQLDAHATTLLSPYLTHGLIGVRELLTLWNSILGFTLGDRLCQTLLRREYALHVWRHRGEEILARRTTPIDQLKHRSTLPSAVRLAATGIPVIDASVRQLYATGHLHHLQRQWLASYLVHMRKVDWQAGAQWMYGHLLDGDLAACYLAWQAVAGNQGGEPYLFNAQAVARQAPALDSSATALDCTLAAIAQIAHAAESLPGERICPLPQREPPLLDHPRLLAERPAPPPMAGRSVHIVHPWALGTVPQADVVVGVIHLPFHARHPWSAARWNFVLTRMQRIVDTIWVGDLNHAHRWLAGAQSVSCQPTAHAEYRQAFDRVGVMPKRSQAEVVEPGYLCASFEVYLQAQRKLMPELTVCPLAGQVRRLRGAQLAARNGSAKAPCPDSSALPDRTDA